MLDANVFQDPTGGREALLAAYVEQYNNAVRVAESAEKDTDQVSASRAALAALGDIARITGALDVKDPTATIRYVIEGLPTVIGAMPGAAEVKSDDGDA